MQVCAGPGSLALELGGVELQGSGVLLDDLDESVVEAVVALRLDVDCGEGHVVQAAGPVRQVERGLKEVEGRLVLACAVSPARYRLSARSSASST